MQELKENKEEQVPAMDKKEKRGGTHVFRQLILYI